MMAGRGGVGKWFCAGVPIDVRLWGIPDGQVLGGGLAKQKHNELSIVPPAPGTAPHANSVPKADRGAQDGQ